MIGKYTSASLVIFFSLSLAACGGGGGDKTDASNSSPVAGSGSDALVMTSITPVSAGTECPAGGYHVAAGTDTNGNSVLDAAEVTNTGHICNGQNGADGTNGTNGVDGANGKNALIRTQPIAAGSQCLAGGTDVQYGLDTNGDGALDDNEVTGSSAVCNGEKGQDGSGAASSYTVMASAGAGGSISPAGASQVAAGTTTSFTLTPDTGLVAGVSSTCGGSLVGNVFTTGSVTADCSVIASFVVQHQVNTQVGVGLVPMTVSFFDTSIPNNKYGSLMVNRPLSDDVYLFGLGPTNASMQHFTRQVDGRLAQVDVLASTMDWAPNCGTWDNPSNSCIAFAPSGQYAYVAGGQYDATTDTTTYAIFQYAVANDGSLTQLTAPSIPTTTAVKSIVLSPDGKHAYTSDGGTIALYDVSQNGELTLLNVDVAAGYAITLNAAGSSAYVQSCQISTPESYVQCYGVGDYDSSLGDGTFITHSLVNADGSLSPQSVLTVLGYSGKLPLVFSASGDYAYLLSYVDSGTGDVSSMLYQYKVASDDSLALNQPPVAISSGLSEYSQIIPSLVASDFFIVNHDESPLVLQYSLDSTGAFQLAHVSNISSVSWGTAISTISFDASGRYAYALGEDSSGGWQFNLGVANGGTISDPVVVADGSPARIVVTPNPGYRINSVTGCNGTLSDNNTYVTGSVFGDCTVTATFLPE